MAAPRAHICPAVLEVRYRRPEGGHQPLHRLFLAFGIGGQHRIVALCIARGRAVEPPHPGSWSGDDLRLRGGFVYDWGGLTSQSHGGSLIACEIRMATLLPYQRQLCDEAAGDEDADGDEDAAGWAVVG